MNWIHLPAEFDADKAIALVVYGKDAGIKIPAKEQVEAQTIRKRLHEAALRQIVPIRISILGMPPMMEVHVEKYQ